ncbi:PAS domain S-box protein [Niveibacterium sp. SC-1]|uniref:PAS domain S-box protein n=1 Tax=Niveibacterium sp. SC-1 TaxID=3135646 RepID=UPI00311EEB3A
MSGVVERLSRRLDSWSASRLEFLVGAAGLVLVLLMLALALVPLNAERRTREREATEQLLRVGDSAQRQVLRVVDMLDYLAQGAWRIASARPERELRREELPRDYRDLITGTRVIRRDGEALMQLGFTAPDPEIMLGRIGRFDERGPDLLPGTGSDLIFLRALPEPPDRGALIAFALDRRRLRALLASAPLPPGTQVQLARGDGLLLLAWGEGVDELEVPRGELSPQAIAHANQGQPFDDGDRIAVAHHLADYPLVLSVRTNRPAPMTLAGIGLPLVAGLLFLALFVAGLTLVLMAAARALGRARLRDRRETALFDVSPDPTIVVRETRAGDFVCERINPAGARIFQAGELALGSPIALLARGESLRRALISSARQPNAAHASFDLVIPAPAGDRLVQLDVVPMPGEESGERLFAIVGRDLTEQRRAERNLRERSLQLEAIIDSAMDAIIITDEHRRIIMFNKAAEQQFGYNALQVMGRDPIFLIPERYQSDHHERFADYAQHYAGWRIARRDKPMLARCADGSELPVEVSISRVDIDERRLFTVILRDMRERLEAEREIHDLNDSLERRVAERTAELQRAYQEMEAFSYSVSHDLRAPLRAIHGYTYLLIDGEAQRLSEEGRQFLEKVMRASVRMGELIDDFLDFSRVGRTELAASRVDMNRMVSEVVAELRGDHPEAAISVSLLPPAYGDPRLLRQVWHNLLTNALKFSAQEAQPRVDVGMRVEQGRAWYFVSDNGIGFDMTYATKLFGVFQRLHTSRDFDGTGIGLAIVKRVMERHGGEVRAESEPGKGATFGFSLPD